MYSAFRLSPFRAASPPFNEFQLQVLQHTCTHPIRGGAEKNHSLITVSEQRWRHDILLRQLHQSINQSTVVRLLKNLFSVNLQQCRRSTAHKTCRYTTLQNMSCTPLIHSALARYAALFIIWKRPWGDDFPAHDPPPTRHNRNIKSKSRSSHISRAITQNRQRR